MLRIIREIRYSNPEIADEIAGDLDIPTIDEAVHDGLTMLQLAARAGHPGVVLALISSGASIDKVSDEFKHPISRLVTEAKLTPLMLANKYENPLAQKILRAFESFPFRKNQTQKFYSQIFLWGFLHCTEAKLMTLIKRSKISKKDGFDFSVLAALAEDKALYNVSRKLKSISCSHPINSLKALREKSQIFTAHSRLLNALKDPIKYSNRLFKLKNPSDGLIVLNFANKSLTSIDCQGSKSFFSYIDKYNLSSYWFNHVITCLIRRKSNIGARNDLKFTQLMQINEPQEIADIIAIQIENLYGYPCKGIIASRTAEDLYIHFESELSKEIMQEIGLLYSRFGYKPAQFKNSWERYFDFLPLKEQATLQSVSRSMYRDMLLYWDAKQNPQQHFKIPSLIHDFSDQLDQALLKYTESERSIAAITRVILGFAITLLFFVALGHSIYKGDKTNIIVSAIGASLFLLYLIGLCYLACKTLYPEMPTLYNWYHDTTLQTLYDLMPQHALILFKKTLAQLDKSEVLLNLSGERAIEGVLGIIEDLKIHYPRQKLSATPQVVIEELNLTPRIYQPQLFKSAFKDNPSDFKEAKNDDECELISLTYA